VPPTCAVCHSAYDNSALFCPNCGAAPGEPGHSIYGGSLLLAIGLLVLVGVWQLASLRAPVTKTAPVRPESPDDATLLIQRCGRPDADALGSHKDTLGDVGTRALIYRNAKVSAVFKGGDETRWKAQGFFDTRTQKPLSNEQLVKRLPCAVQR
jgi:hypothetical protein